MKKRYDDLMLELTRKCNLECDHCLRGCTQDLSMDISLIDKILDETESINQISFTGGEPMIEGEKIIYIIDKIENDDFYEVEE